jgi:RNA exonuclease 4
MGGLFLTKKQKSQMRDRRKKKLSAQKENGEDVDPIIGSTKRKREEEAPQEPRTVVVPLNLHGAEARKFRKDARRKARQDGLDESLVTFVMEGQEEREEARAAKKRNNKVAKTYPSINELLKQQELDKEKQEKADALQKVDDALPESYKAKYVGLDCEMVGIGAEGKQSALARVSLTDWNGKAIMDTFVQVPSRVTDFRTFVSGVTAKHIQKESAMEVKKCRNMVASLLKGKILVGHALQNDLQALMMQHPKENIRDTAKYRPFQRVVGSKWRPRKLRDLVKQHLGIAIQVAGEAHDSVEDASATMDLFKRVREEWEKELEAKQKKSKKKKR